MPDGSHSSFPDREIWALCERIALPIREGGGLALSGQPARGGQTMGMDFERFEEYVPGRSLRHLDWAMYARTGRYYVRQFEDEGSGVLHILLDASGSMGLGQPTKWSFTRRLGAVLIFAALRELHQVRVGVINDGQTHWLPMRSGLDFAPAALSFVGDFLPAGETNLTAACDALMNAEARGTVMILSDFLDADGATTPITRLKHLGFAVELCRVSAAGEFNLQGMVGALADAEGHGVVAPPADAHELRALEAKIIEHRAAVSTAAKRIGANLVECESQMPLGQALDALSFAWSSAHQGANT